MANAGPQKWDYCSPKADYADVRRRVGHAFAEKANEIADAISVVQSLSKEATRLFQGLAQYRACHKEPSEMGLPKWTDEKT